MQERSLEQEVALRIEVQENDQQSVGRVTEIRHVVVPAHLFVVNPFAYEKGREQNSVKQVEESVRISAQEEGSEDYHIGTEDKCYLILKSRERRRPQILLQNLFLLRKLLR